jgi:3-oxoacyl-[acyl-carrier protein] reductase
MEMTTSNRSALVTGASRGIGRAIALRLASMGYEIVAVARSTDLLESLAREIGAAGGACRSITLDLRDARATEERLAGLAVDVLVHDAGVGVIRPLAELAPEDWATMIDVNVNALYHATRPILPAMLERGSGHIVLIGSIGGRSAFVGGSCYAATKAFVNAFAESLMLEVRGRGVKVSVVTPGGVETGFSGRGAGGGASWKLSPEDVAASVAHVLDTPPDVLVHRLEVRALTPEK